MPKYERYSDIPKFIRGADYRVDVPWEYLPRNFVRNVRDGLDVNPNFQRGRVWTPEQKIKYIEFCVKGGSGGRDIYTNCPGWNRGIRTLYVLVDGKQRLDAVLGYMNNEFPIFEDCYFNTFKQKMDIFNCRFSWHVNELKTIEEVYEWYIDLNTGGTIHTDEEINKVKALLEKKVQYQAPCQADLYIEAGFEREVIGQAIIEMKEEEKQREEAALRMREAYSKRKGSKKKK